MGKAYKELQEKLPTDLVPGYVVSSGDDVDPQTAWLKGLKRFSEDLGENAFAYFNYTARKGPLRAARRRPRKIMSGEGFPPWVNIGYAYPPPQAFYTPWKARTVKHIVLHTFGHGFMSAAQTKRKPNGNVVATGKWIGWMNSKRKNRGVQQFEYEGKTVYVPKGSDENQHHPRKFSAGLSACLNSSRKASAHFFIDRNGNLMIIGDINDILFTQNALNKTGVGIEMEEACYVEEPLPKKVRLRAAGDPPLTGGNVIYPAFSALQLLTLSIVCRKLETAFPEIERRTLLTPHSANKKSPPGYTMHLTAKGGSHSDASPHFLDEHYADNFATWDDFFALVDEQDQVTADNLWKPQQKYKRSTTGEELMHAPVSEDVTNNFTQMLLSFSHSMGVGVARASASSETTKSEVNEEAGKQATKEAQKVKNEMANTHQTTQPAAQKKELRMLPSKETTKDPLTGSGSQPFSTSIF